MWHKWCNQSSEYAEDDADRGLRGTAQWIVRRTGVEPILKDVVVSRRKDIGTEWINQILECAVEFVGLVGFGDFTYELCQFIKRPFIDRI